MKTLLLLLFPFAMLGGVLWFVSLLASAVPTMP